MLRLRQVIIAAALVACTRDEGPGATAAAAGSGGAAQSAATAGAAGSCPATDRNAVVYFEPPGELVDVADAGIEPVEVTLAPCSIQLFDLPINSVRYAASGYDPATRVCASIIWDYSNNEIEIERRCGDFLELDADGFPLHLGFPYVVLRRERDTACSGLWDYGGPEPSAASGCIDPIEKAVDARVDVEVGGVRYLIRAQSPPAATGP